MKLTLKDRFSLMALLSGMQRTGGFMEMMNKAAMNKALMITPEEQVKYNIQDTEGGVTWNPALDSDKEVEFTDPQLELLKNAIVDLSKDTESQISYDEAETYLKFIDLNQIP